MPYECFPPLPYFVLHDIQLAQKKGKMCVHAHVYVCLLILQYVTRTYLRYFS